MAKIFTLGKEERLKSRKQTEHVFSEGVKFMMTPVRIHYTLSRAEEPLLLFGAGVSKKNFRKAVDRNRIKRLLREAYRLQKNSLQECLKEQGCQLHLFMIYTGKEMPLYKELFEKTGKAISKLCVIVSDIK